MSSSTTHFWANVNKSVSLICQGSDPSEQVPHRPSHYGQTCCAGLRILYIIALIINGNIHTNHLFRSSTSFFLPERSCIEFHTVNTTLGSLNVNHVFPVCLVCPLCGISLLACLKSLNGRICREVGGCNYQVGGCLISYNLQPAYM